jgi:hypothetical protein
MLKERTNLGKAFWTKGKTVYFVILGTAVYTYLTRQEKQLIRRKNVSPTPNSNSTAAWAHTRLYQVSLCDLEYPH